MPAELGQTGSTSMLSQHLELYLCVARMVLIKRLSHIMKANFAIPSGLLLAFSVAQRERLEVRWLDSYWTNDCFELVHYQNLLSLVSRPGSGWVSPSQRPATQHSSGIGCGSGNAGCLAER